LKDFEKNFKVREGLREQYEYCVNHKNKNEIKLILGGHLMIKNENGSLKRI
jgi:hypothetical protein